jgi:hypothetical protein
MRGHIAFGQPEDSFLTRLYAIQPRKTAFTVVCLKILEALPLGNETKKQMK